MLNIFNGRKPLPKYRLIAPQSGEYQTITVHEDVGLSFCTPDLELIPVVDSSNTTLCFGCHITEHQAQQG